MRFDDSLTTVLAFDMAPGTGARSAWRQLVDLVGRGRVSADEEMLARLRTLRPSVPEQVRVATARALATVGPGTGITALFADDVPPVADTLLQSVVLSDATWEKVLPILTSTQRSLLRGRRDLPDAAVRRLDAMASMDVAPNVAADPTPEPVIVPEAPAGDPSPLLDPPARASGPATPSIPDYPLPDLVDRIERFRRARAERSVEAPAPLPDATRFAFRADASGMLVSIQDAEPGALVGLSLAHSGKQGIGQVDGAVAGAFRRRSRFTDARLEVGGEGEAAGSWRISGVPAFDPASGRFIGYDGVARRPRSDESAASTRLDRADSLRQIVHELRTPANAITGFAELIESELMGPVPASQRSRATAIRTCASELVAAIDDLDTAARIDGRVLELQPIAVSLPPLLDRILEDLSALIGLRGAALEVSLEGDVADVLGDDRIMERLLGRLTAVLVAAASADERLTIAVEGGGDSIRVALSRPAAWQGLDEAALFSMEADGVADGAPLLGTGFCLRLARNLAAELGGSLAVRSDTLVLRLPALLSPPLGHAAGT